LFDPNNALIPRKAGFEMIYSILGDTCEGIIDITLFINPYEKYPSERYTLWDVICRRSRTINFCFLINYIPNTPEMGEEDWIYELYRSKDELIDLYKADDCNRYYDDLTFAKKFEKLCKDCFDKYSIQVVHIRSTRSRLLILFFFGCTIFAIYILKVIIRVLKRALIYRS
jgi:hypothetical protein